MCVLAITDALNVIQTSFPEAALPDYADDLAAARHLSKHIWPSQYQLDIGQSPRNESRGKLDEAIMTRGSVNTPSCLKATLPLLHEMLGRHRTYRYTDTLKNNAPSAVSTLVRKFPPSLTSVSRAA